jgi:MYXO-CTERM domain-containing protein
MRLPVTAFALLMCALAAAEPVVAQVLPAPLFQATIETPSPPVDPGNSTTVTIHIVRQCPNAAAVMDRQVVHLRVTTDGPASAAGPTATTFEQRLCAQQVTDSQVVEYAITVKPDAARLEPVSFVFSLQADPGSALASRSPEQSMPFAIMVSPAPAVAQVTATPTQASPAASMPLMALAVLVAVAVLRRRA